MTQSVSTVCFLVLEQEKKGFEINQSLCSVWFISDLSVGVLFFGGFVICQFKKFKSHRHWN